MAELHDVEEWLGALLSQLEPAARKKMLHEVAHDVRRIQQNNITMQHSPDGTAWEPRRVTARTKPGRIRRKMFAKLRTAKFLEAQSNDKEALVTFSSNVQRLARVHHFGLREKLKFNGAYVQYSQRKLLGINSDVELCVENKLLDHLLS